MAKIRYRGHLDGVIVPLPTGGHVEVMHGKELQTSDEHAAHLLEQAANWELVAQPARKASADSPAESPSEV